MKRDILEKLRKWKDKPDRKPLILSGARQVGKTYVLKEFGSTFFPKYHYFNFEKNKELHKIFEVNLDPQRIIQELGIFINASINIKNDLIVFDEIQECPKSLTSLKYFCEEMPDLAICSAGSLLGVLLGESSFPVGKVDSLYMYPLSFFEFLLGIGEDKLYDFLLHFKHGQEISAFIHSKVWDKVKLYFIVGGLPEVINKFNENKHDLFKAFLVARETQENLINFYLADIAKHSGKVNSMHIDRVLRNIPAQLAREQDGGASRFKFKGILPDLERYSRLSGVIDWLENAKLIIKVQIASKANLPLSAYTKENIFKLYIFDVGILGALSNLSPNVIFDYNYGTYKGYFAENFIAQEFLSSGVHKLYSWAEGQAEIEFLRDVDGNSIPIEVKSGWVTQSKSLKVFMQKYNPQFGTIMSAKNYFFDKKKNVAEYPLYLASRFPIKV